MDLHEGEEEGESSKMPLDDIALGKDNPLVGKQGEEDEAKHGPLYVVLEVGEVPGAGEMMVMLLSLTCSLAS